MWCGTWHRVDLFVLLLVSDFGVSGKHLVCTWKNIALIDLLVPDITASKN